MARNGAAASPGLFIEQMVRSQGQWQGSLPFSLPLCHAVVANSDVFIKWICTAAAASVELSSVKRFRFGPVARLPESWASPRCAEGKNDAAEAATEAKRKKKKKKQFAAESKRTNW